MTNKHNGGPAFPFGQISETTGQPVNGFYDPGMTLRDYFAAKAMQASLSRGTPVNTEAMAKAAYAYADAMIAQREKQHD